MAIKDKKEKKEEDFFNSKDLINKGKEPKSWLTEDYSGQLAVDVFQDKNNIIVKSAVAGLKPEDLDISINNDMITIRGTRHKDHQVEEDDYFYKECYWGGFSRSIILPCEVKIDKIEASLKNGILTVILPKVTKTGKVKLIKVKEEE